MRTDTNKKRFDGENENSILYREFLGSPDISFTSRIFSFLLFSIICIFGVSNVFSQTMYPPNNIMPNQPYNIIPNQPYNNFMANSTAFKQEIARMEINVVRQGKMPLPITKVPRLEKDDVLKVRLLDEQVNGVKPDQSNFDWTFLVAYINPGRNSDSQKTVSEEINFRKRGWYKEYSFVVPYDCQPIFFIYPKPEYRNKILSLVGKNQDEIRKIGEKTIEISDAYAKIGGFLNELQSLLIRNSYGMYGNYGGYGNYNYYGGYGNYGSGGSFNQNLFMQQAVEQMAKSFNIQLPSCWTNNNFGGYGGYNNYYGNNNNFLNNSLVERVQCVARSVKVEDLDISISRMLQQGGVLGAAQLAQKYPQVAFWINVAAAALDFIIQITKKTPLKIVPTVISTGETQGQNSIPMNMNGTANMPYQGAVSNSVKISLFAESQPSNNGFVTAYPLVISKWQPNSDPNIISLPIPSLADSCLHAGQNILRSTDLMNDWMSDNFTENFRLVVSSPNGFTKEFPLRKNIGLSGWELNLTKEDFNAFPKINMNLESELVGKRGFNEIRSPKFQLAIPVAGSWEITSESQKMFAAGAKRTVTLRNQFGSCKCLQAVVYKPAFGGQFVFEANSQANPLMFSDDGKEVSFEVDATNFQPGPGQFELQTAGGETTSLDVNLYPMMPNVTNVRIAKKDNKAVITGERLEQIQAIRINGKRATIEAGGKIAPMSNTIVPMGNTIIPMNNQNNMPTANPMFASGSSERTFVFEDPAARQETNNFSIELELEGGRIYQYPKTFSISPSRPVLVSKQIREIEAIATGNKTRAQFDLEALPIFPIDSSKISLIVQNALTDYDFKIENIEVETRIENSQVYAMELPKVTFEVLDWKNMQITLQLNEQLQRLLGGRRLQFRIRDKERGDSDWYTLGKTFARLPENISVRCTNQPNGDCQMKGTGIEYISQVSVDGGKSWYPQSPASLVVQPTQDGEKVVKIPRYSNKNLLQIRLRDFPMTEGLAVHDYIFVNAGGRRN